MVTHRRRKVTRQRGGTTHGWGARKKHRGSGNRGGVGNAGSGKRAHCKKPSYWAIPLYFGMHGFKSKGTKITFTCINVGELDRLAIKAGKNTFKLSDFGYNKLLGCGDVTKAYDVTVDYASKGAVSKILHAKGKVNVLNMKEDAKGKPASSEE